MTLLEIKREIGKKLGDPDLSKYRGVVKDAFTDSIVSMLHAEDYTEEEIFSLVLRKETSGVVNGSAIPWNSASGDLYPIKIISVVGSIAGSDDHMIRKTPQEIDRIKTDSELAPLTNEIFYYLIGNKIFFHPATKTPTVVVKYIKEPEFDGWTDATEVDNFYRLTFIKRAINRSISLLGGGIREAEKRPRAEAQ